MGVDYKPFLFDLESRMRIIQENEFANVAADEEMWWDTVTKIQPTSQNRKELFFWILSTATIEPQGYGGNVQFDDMVILESDYTHLDAGKGLRLKKNQVKDLDGNGIQIASEWISQITGLAAYWPQQQISNLLVNGETGICYDGGPYFSATHPNNPFDASAGQYANLLTGSPSGIYPGALKIDESVTLDVAFANIGKMVAYIKSLKMPNGKTPRRLKPVRLIVPPAMQNRAVLLTSAKSFGLQVTGGAAAADVEGTIAKWGIKDVTVAPELGSSFTGNSADDTSWYIACEQVTKTQLGGMVYIDREPFGVTYYTGDGGGTGMDAVLDRARELEWHQHGRNAAGYGHPFGIFKAKAT